HQFDKLLRRKTGKRRPAEMGVAGKVVFRCGVTSGEVASSATRNTNFFGQPARMIQQQDRTAALARFNGTHHSRCPRTDYSAVLLQGHNRIFGKPDLVPMYLLYATR